MLIKILLLLIFISPAHSVERPSYSLVDLEVLAKEKNHLEFLKHAHDVRPSKRDKMWKELVRSMALGYLNEAIKNKKFEKETFNFVEKLNTWPTLRKEEFFLQKRNQLGIGHLRLCFLSEKNCLPKTLSFWNSNLLKSAELGLKMVDLLKKNNYQGDLFNFINPATTSEVSEFYCKRPEVVKILTKKIHEISLRNAIKKKHFKKIFNQNCLVKIIPILKQELVKFSSPAMKEMFYNFLEVYSAMDQKERDFFLTLYILQGPVKGDAFNEGWNLIKILGNNYKRRQQVLSRLEKFELLPDDIFALPNVKTKRTLLSHLFKNMPEYLDYYARTCLDYLEGKKVFPRGNPTLHCKELFKEAKGTPWIEPGLQARFQNFKTL
jgi:hypothetical protein